MVNVNDPFGSIFNSIQAAISPIESGIRSAAKDLELCWKEHNNNGIGVELVAGVNGSGRNRMGPICSSASKKSNGRCVVDGARKLGVSVEALLGGICGDFDSGHEVGVLEKELNVNDVNKGNVAFVESLQFAMCWHLMLDSVSQVIPSPFRSGKKLRQNVCDNEKSGLICGKNFLCEGQGRDFGIQSLKDIKDKGIVQKENGKRISIECSIGLMFDQIIESLQKFGQGMKVGDMMECKSPDLSSPSFEYVHCSKINLNRFAGNLNFARIGGVPPCTVEIASNEEAQDGITSEIMGESDSSPTKGSSGVLGAPLSDVERLRSTLSPISFTDFIALVPQSGQFFKDDHPDMKKLLSVQAFFKYAESEGRKFFQKLDRDCDGQITLEDLEVEMRKRKLPQRNAQELIRQARSHLYSKSLGWKQFLSLMEQKEPMILRAYTSLGLGKSEKFLKGEILESLANAGLPANEENAVALMHFLNADTERSISYGHFRNFMLLLPSERLKGNSHNIWFEDSTTVADAPSLVKFSAGSVLRSALAGGLSCALSAALMHPLDTVKTRIQASTQLGFLDIISKLPQIGPRGLYRGLIPTVVGQFSSHGLRTGFCEATKFVISNVAPTIADIQVQSIASFGGTFLGTVMRIPCEVLKQRLQAGLYENLGEAAIGTWHQNGLRGLFHGTGVTLFREIPFYVAGTGLYEESKKVVQHLLGRELEPWETIAVGALSGGLTAVLTTPFDVIKTRMMISQHGQPLSMSVVAVSLLRHEGALALFKGAVPRFFWIAPLGAMNLAGYELAKKALDKCASKD